MKRKWIRRAVFSFVIGFALLGGVTALSYSRRAPSIDPDGRFDSITLTVPFRTWQEHDALYPPEDESYVIQMDAPSGTLLYFGAKHSRDRNHPQRQRIEEQWNQFQPTVALHEGRSRGFLIGPFYERIVGLPEPAIVHQLARRDDVPLYSLEPPYESEIKALLKRWSAEQLALYFTMRVYWSEAAGQANDALAAELLTKRTNTPSLQRTFSTVKDIDRIWKRDFPEQRDWRTLTSEPSNTYLHRISDDSRVVRGEHMVRALVDLVQRGERVFAVVGCSHVIRQEPTLSALLATSAQ